MSKLRSLNTVIWSDPWFELLTPSEKLLFIYFVTNEKTNMLGVYEISVRKVSFETGIKESDIIKFLKNFEIAKKIRYDDNHVLLLNFLKHQNYNFNMMKSAIRTYNNLPANLKTNNINKLEETKEGFQTLCNGFRGVRKIEVEYEVEEEREIEIEKKPPTAKYVFSFYKELVNLGADKDLVNDWIKVRKTKKATNTQTAFNGFKNQLGKTTLDINEVLSMCVLNSWSGFKSEWAKVEEDKKVETERNLKREAYKNKKVTWEDFYGKQD